MRALHDLMSRPRRAATATVAAFCLLAIHPAAGQEQPAQGSAEAGQAKSATCAACHGVDGNSVTPDWPTLAGQSEDYLVRQLMAFKEGLRQDAGMRGFASTLSEQDMHDLAAYYAEQTPNPKGADPSLVSRGQQIYRGGIPDRGIPACTACHGPTGKGIPMAGFPRVSHQHAAYLATTLRAYQSGQRRSDAELNQVMRNVAEMLLDEEITALASYMQGLR